MMNIIDKVIIYSLAIVGLIALGLYINEHIHVMCLFGKCAAVVN